MHKNSIKLQLSAMNKAVMTFAEKECKKSNLSVSDFNTIKQSVVYSSSYDGIEVFRSSKIYEPMLNRSRAIKKDILAMEIKE